MKTWATFKLARISIGINISRGGVTLHLQSRFRSQNVQNEMEKLSLQTPFDTICIRAAHLQCLNFPSGLIGPTEVRWRCKSHLEVSSRIWSQSNCGLPFSLLPHDFAADKFESDHLKCKGHLVDLIRVTGKCRTLFSGGAFTCTCCLHAFRASEFAYNSPCSWRRSMHRGKKISVTLRWRGRQTAFAKCQLNKETNKNGSRGVPGHKSDDIGSASTKRYTFLINNNIWQN